MVTITRYPFASIVETRHAFTASRFRQLSLIFAFTLGLFISLLSPAAYAANAEVTKQGKWVKKSYKVNGTWQIIKEDGKTFIQFSNDFKTKSAPDLKIFLSKKSAKEVKNKTAVPGSKFIAKLKKVKGSQRYEIPASVNIDDYQSLLIHCQQYTKLWAAGDLRKS